MSASEPFLAPLTLLQFKTARLREEFEWVHPTVAKAANELAAWSRQRGLPPVVVTDAMRTKAKQEELYWQRYFVDSRKSGKPLTEEQAKAAARDRFSWHLVRCALDFSDKHYTPPQRAEVLAHLKEGRAAPVWEVLGHNVGAGEHLHLAIRSRDWRKKYGGA